MFEAGSGADRRRCLQLREESGRGGVVRVQNRPVLERNPVGELFVEEDSIIMLSKMSGLETVGLANGASVSYEACEN